MFQCVYLLQELLLCLCLCRDTVLDMLHDCGSSCIGLPFENRKGCLCPLAPPHHHRCHPSPLSPCPYSGSGPAPK